MGNISTKAIVIVSKDGLSTKLNLSKNNLQETDSPTSSVTVPIKIDSLSDDQSTRDFPVYAWDGKKMYSDLISEGLQQLGKDTKDVLMLYESPSSSLKDTSFQNSQVFKLHDYPPTSPYVKLVLTPCRYSVMNGTSCSCYLKDSCPAGLIDHWKDTIPDFQTPSFTSKIEDYSKVYAYLPLENLDADHHVINPHFHYHFAGKDALSLITDRTTKLLTNTKDQRPCVAKVTHAMGSKGIFVIENDEDEQEFHDFLDESGNPNYVITEFVSIQRNVACHFFIHPSGEITWIGSNENIRLPDGSWSTDSYIIMSDQEYLKDIQLPFVQDVAKYALKNRFWGFCGCDVLFDANGKGYLVDVNPRVTGTSPALMVAKLLEDKYGFGFGLFRRTDAFAYSGSQDALFQEVKEYNERNNGNSRVVLHSVYEKSQDSTAVNLGVYGHSLEECERVLNHFSPRPKVHVSPVSVTNQ